LRIKAKTDRRDMQGHPRFVPMLSSYFASGPRPMPGGVLLTVIF